MSWYTIVDIPSLQNHAYIQEGMLHDTLSPGWLQNFVKKEGEMPSHVAPQTDTYVGDTNKTTEDAKTHGYKEMTKDETWLTERS